MPGASSRVPLASGATGEGGLARRGAGAWWRWVPGLAVGVVLFYLAAGEVNWADLAGALGGADRGWLALSWGTIVAGTLAKGLRWRVLLADDASRPGWLRLTGILSIGQLVNAVVPARLGELSRAYLAGRSHHGGFGLALSTVLLEKVLDGVALLAIAAGLAIAVALPSWFTTAALTFGAVWLAIVGALEGLIVAEGPLRRWAGRLPGRLARPTLAGLEGAGRLRRRRVLVGAVGLTGAVWVLGPISNYALLLSLGVEVPASAAMLLAVVYYLAVLIPGVPAQLGLFHYVTVLSLGAYGVGRAEAMPYAVLLHGLIYGTILAAGLIGALVLDVRLPDLPARLRALRGEGKGG